MFSLQVGNVSPESLGYLNRVRQRNSLGPSRDGNNFAVSFTSYPHCHPHHHKLFQLTLFLITILIIILMILFTLPLPRWFTVRVTSRTGLRKEFKWRGALKTNSMQAVPAAWWLSAGSRYVSIIVI